MGSGNAITKAIASFLLGENSVDYEKENTINSLAFIDLSVFAI
jgi:hypothetical protein